VLINVHGGGFIFGRPWVGQMEAVPVAATAGIRVVTVDYRMAPEHEFPAASEDVAKVYRHLLGQYAPGNIGIYGCSAGAVLTSQSVVWIEKEGLPRPGAVAMLGAAGGYWGEGDAGHFCAARSGIPLAELADPCRNPYFRNADPADPLVFPMRSRAHLARFPASLLVAATRDLALSSVVHMHCLLVALGVPADLHVWEGLDHAFHYWPDLPQSREVYQVIARFFDRHLR
jgi:acetyl esterase/lipase